MVKKNLISKLVLTAGLSFFSGCIGFQKYVKGRDARPYQTYTEVAENQDIHYVKRGEGRKVMLFHGLAGSVYDWKEVVPRLAENYEVWAIDLPGFGDSDPVEGQKTVKDLVERVNVFMVKNDIESAVFVGHSMGNTFNDAFSKAYPKKVDMMISVSGYIDAEHSKVSDDVAKVVKIPVFGDVLVFLAKITTGKGAIRKIVERYTYDDSTITQGRINKFYEDLQSKIGFDVFVRMGVNFSPWDIERNESIPYYPIVGRDDKLISVTNFDYPNLGVINKCGHFLPSEKPEELCDIIDEVMQVHGIR